MPAFLKLGSFEGDSTDAGHVKWIRIDAVTLGASRSIAAGVVDQQRTRGETTLADISVNKQLDASSTKLVAACATGQFIDTAQIDLCTTINKKQVPYLTYKLKNVIVTSYGVSASGEGMPSEDLTLNFTEVAWDYSVLNTQTGVVKGHIPGTYSIGESKAT